MRKRHGLQAGDVVERAGYPAEDNVRVRMVRDGKTVLVLSVSPAPAGGWLVTEGMGCSSFESKPAG